MRSNTFQEKYITLKIDDYDSKDDMFKDVSSLLNILTKNGYQCAFRYEDVGVYVLEFDHDNPDFGSPMIHWLDDEQLECLFTEKHIDDEEDND